MRKRKGCGCFSLVVVLLIIVLLAGIGIKNKDKILALFYPRDYENIISAYCDEYGVDKWLVFALVKAESGFDQDAVSSAGAHGLTVIAAISIFLSTLTRKPFLRKMVTVTA